MDSSLYGRPIRADYDLKNLGVSTVHSDHWTQRRHSPVVCHCYLRSRVPATARSPPTCLPTTYLRVSHTATCSYNISCLPKPTHHAHPHAYIIHCPYLVGPPPPSWDFLLPLIYIWHVPMLNSCLGGRENNDSGGLGRGRCHCAGAAARWPTWTSTDAMTWREMDARPFNSDGGHRSYRWFCARRCAATSPSAPTGQLKKAERLPVVLATIQVSYLFHLMFPVS